MNILQKIRNLPESQRKIILWIIVIIVGIILMFFYAKNVQEKIKSLNIGKFKEEMQFPKLEEELRNLPKFEMPNLQIPTGTEQEIPSGGEVQI